MNVPIDGRALAPLTRRATLGYSAGALLDGIAGQGVNIFLFFYVTTVAGLSAALAGIALAVGLAVDAVVDPLIGSLSDNSRSRFGRRLPFMMMGLPATAAFLIAMFSLPSGWSQLTLFAWLTFLSIGLRVGMSLFLLPYNAVGAEISDDYTERSSIAMWRWAFAMVGALVAIVLGFGVFLGGDGGLSRRGGYTPLAISLAAIAAVGALIAMRTLASMRDRQHVVAANQPGSLHLRLLAEVGEIFRNQSFRTLFIGALLLFTSLAIHSSLGLHANTYFWRLSAAQIQIVTLSLFAGLLLGAPLAAPMLARIEKRTVLLIGMVGLASSTSLPATLRLLGLFPFEGQTLVAVLSAAVLLGGMLMAAAGIAFASMMADAADEHEHLFGARREGLYFAGWAFATKAASGLGSLVSGLALQAIGFQSAGGGAVRLTAGTIRWIGLINGPGAGVLALAAAALCLFYRLDAKRHAAIRRDLGARRRGVFVASPRPLD
ncbi:MFS transporter [Sphingomonas jinjuensis]|uniref:MFS transporter n=1 Tax=Sphingomonas jinjuensis TaxID=535907 RepID=UPI001C856284